MLICPIYFVKFTDRTQKCYRQKNLIDDALEKMNDKIKSLEEQENNDVHHEPMKLADFVKGYAGA
jgi:hypothetical protein